MQRSFPGLVTTLLLPAALLLAPDAVAQEVIKIGIPVRLSGANSVAAPSMVQSAELAAEEITYNRTGLPAISVPCGLDREGLPIGLQTAGRPFAEPTVLEVAHAHEQAHDWKDRHPAQ